MEGKGRRGEYEKGTYDSFFPSFSLVSDKAVRCCYQLAVSLKMSWQGQRAFYFIKKCFPRKLLCLKLWKLFGVLRALKDLGYFKAGNKKLGKRKNFQSGVGMGRFSPSLPQNWRRNKNWRRKKKNLSLT